MQAESRSPADFYASCLLQDLVEKVMILRRAVELSRGQTTNGGEALSVRLSQYAGILAAQGSLATASSYLKNSSNDVSI